jgi:hypothetical protein
MENNRFVDMGESILHIGIEKIPQSGVIKTKKSEGGSIKDVVLLDLSEIITPRNT